MTRVMHASSTPRRANVLIVPYINMPIIVNGPVDYAVSNQPFPLLPYKHILKLMLGSIRELMLNFHINYDAWMNNADVILLLDIFVC